MSWSEATHSLSWTERKWTCLSHQPSSGNGPRGGIPPVTTESMEKLRFSVYFRSLNLLMVKMSQETTAQGTATTACGAPPRRTKTTTTLLANGAIVDRVPRPWMVSLVRFFELICQTLNVSRSDIVLWLRFLYFAFKVAQFLCCHEQCGPIWLTFGGVLTTP